MLAYINISHIVTTKLFWVVVALIVIITYWISARAQIKLYRLEEAQETKRDSRLASIEQRLNKLETKDQ